MYDRNIRLEYLHSSIIKKEEPKEDDKPFNNNISISAVANGFTFNLKLPKVKVVKQPYHGDAQIIETDSSAYARIVRKETNGTVTFDISNIAELRSKEYFSRILHLFHNLTTNHKVTISRQLLLKSEILGNLLQVVKNMFHYFK